MAPTVRTVTVECRDTRVRVFSQGRCSDLKPHATKPAVTQPPLTPIGQILKEMFANLSQCLNKSLRFLAEYVQLLSYTDVHHESSSILD